MEDLRCLCVCVGDVVFLALLKGLSKGFHSKVVHPNEHEMTGFLDDDFFSDAGDLSMKSCFWR